MTRRAAVVFRYGRPVVPSPAETPQSAGKFGGCRPPADGGPQGAVPAHPDGPVDFRAHGPHLSHSRRIAWAGALRDHGGAAGGTRAGPRRYRYRPRTSAAGLRTRRAHEDRDRPGKRQKRPSARANDRQPAHPGDSEPGLPELGRGPHGGVGTERSGGANHPAATRPCRSGRHDQIRRSGPAADPRARQRPRDRCARRRRRGGQGAAASVRHRDPQPRRAHRRGCRPVREDLELGDLDGVDESPVRCLDAAASAAMRDAIQAAGQDHDTLGGVFEVLAFGVIPGLGSHVSGDARLDGRIGQAFSGSRPSKGSRLGRASSSGSSRGPAPTTRFSGTPSGGITATPIAPGESRAG